MKPLKVIFIAIASILFMGSSIAPNFGANKKSQKSMINTLRLDIGQCPAVTNLQASGNGSGVHVSWDYSPGAIKYIIGGYFNAGGTTISDSTSDNQINISGDGSKGGRIAVRAECSPGVYSAWVYQIF